MMRTRDFILYMVTVLFLLTGITTTLVAEKSSENAGMPQEIDFKTGTQSLTAKTVPEEDTQAANIARLKEKLAQGEGEVMSAPPTLTSVDETPSVQSPSSTTNFEVVRCGGSPASGLARWPTVGVSLEVTANSRDVIYTQEVDAVVGSSTTPSATSSVVISLPLAGDRNQFDTCIDSSVIGITPTGTILPNQQAALYLGYNQYALVGYAFDGFPIYGPLPDESALDSCGGVNTPAGYQYHVRTNEEYLLRCYAGTPVTPNL